MTEWVRSPGVWPPWIDEILNFGPVAELETKWKASIGDAIVEVLDRRAAALFPPAEETTA